jgi:hypothetical protein
MEGHATTYDETIGYEFGEVSSAMQKAIRRADAKLAGYWALELWESGFGQYVWRRLLTVSAEDCQPPPAAALRVNLRFSYLAPLGCWGILTQEVKALHDAYTEINRHGPTGKPRVSSLLVMSEEIDFIRLRTRPQSGCRRQFGASSIRGNSRFIRSHSRSLPNSHANVPRIVRE